jgi:hypothetical protein
MKTRHLQEIQDKIKVLQEELEDRKRALPRHTLRPHQIIAIEELENQIRELQRLESGRGGPEGKKG